jgi:hypothetical protein
MSGTGPSLLARAVERWVACYTWGLPAEVRDARRAELRSHLFEHLRQAAGEGHSRLRRSLQVLGRVVRGMPDDLAWRLAQPTAAPRRQLLAWLFDWVWNGLLASVLLLAVVRAYAAVTGPAPEWAGPVFLAGSLAALGILVAILMLAGEYAGRWRRQHRGRSGRSPSP